MSHRIVRCWIACAVVLASCTAKLQAWQASETRMGERQLAELQAIQDDIERNWRAGNIDAAIEDAEKEAQYLKRCSTVRSFQRREAACRIDTLKLVQQLPAEVQQAIAQAARENVDGVQKQDAGDFAAAEALFRRVLSVWQKHLGNNNYQVARAQSNLASSLNWQAKYEESQTLYERALQTISNQLGEDSPFLADLCIGLGANFVDQDQFELAENMYRRALRIRAAELGEEHPDTAIAHSALATAYMDQSKFKQALPELQKALAISRKRLGPFHEDTAIFRNNLGHAYGYLGRYAEAESEHRKALLGGIISFGIDHAQIANLRVSLGDALASQGKYASAESEHRAAVQISVIRLGPNHPSTAQRVLALGRTLAMQNRFSEAEMEVRKALAIMIFMNNNSQQHASVLGARSVLGYILSSQGKHAEAEVEFRQAAQSPRPRTAAGSHQLFALSLQQQDRLEDAETHFREALSIRIRGFGASHPDVAYDRLGLAGNLMRRGKLAEAEQEARAALQQFQSGRSHEGEQLAFIHTTIAHVLLRQGRLQEAERTCREAIRIHERNVPDVATAEYQLLGFVLDALDRSQEARDAWRTAAKLRSVGRMRESARGLDRSLVSKGNDPLTVSLAREGRFLEAWKVWEFGLAQGTREELSAYTLRPMTDEERQRDTDLNGQYQLLNEQINKLQLEMLDGDARSQLTRLREQRSQLRAELLQWQTKLDKKYAEFVRHPESLESIQQVIPPRSALIGWVDVKQNAPTDPLPYHWACVVRGDQDPVFVRIRGSGEKGGWTTTDEQLPAELRESLIRGDGDWRNKAARLAEQCLNPLLDHLKDVEHLIVLNSPRLAGVPIDVLTDAMPEFSPRAISCAPSGSVLVGLANAHRDATTPTLLAVGDPAYEQISKQVATTVTPPAKGLVIRSISPNTNAELAGLRQGDLMLSYHGKPLSRETPFQSVRVDASVDRVAVEYWRNGQTHTTHLNPGKLGLSFDPRDPSEAIAAYQESRETLSRSQHREAWPRLPGTRREIEGIAALFGQQNATLLLGEQASEGFLNKTTANKNLTPWSHIHFATHGVANADRPLQSALILASDSASTSAESLALDGRITADQIINSWKLNAELVTLSACETALGRMTQSDGYLGFTQALLIKGADSVLLSLWKVDDSATSLLMQRFYANLLGKRPDLAEPMSKAAALTEAKRWLQDLTSKEISESLTNGTRGRVALLKRANSSTRNASRNRPYSHPRYWAAFTLVGDPD